MLPMGRLALSLMTIVVSPSLPPESHSGWSSQVMALNDWKKMVNPAFEEVRRGLA